MYSASDGIPVESGPIQSGPIEPSAPLIGYENVSEKYTSYSPPPTYQEVVNSFSGIAPFQPTDLTDEEIRNAVKVHVKSKINYSSSALKDMIFKGHTRSIAYVYRLTTLNETRKTKSVYTPYNGGYVDGPSNGPAPHGWSIFIKPPDAFVKGKSGAVAVPHTEVVRPCFRCHGSTRERCSSCSGNGSKSCTWCSGRGTRDNTGRCTSCSGTGRDRCTWCHGTGTKSCGPCSGNGSLKHWIQIKAQWDFEVDEFVSTADTLKEKDLVKAQGFTLLDETHPRVQALQSHQFPDEPVVIFSQSVTSKPSKEARIIRQNQSIKAVPVTAVSFSHRADSGTFYVYGVDNRVHFDNYPSKNCCIS